MNGSKKLIEVAIPSEANNTALARQKIAYLHAHSGELHLRSIRWLQAVLLPTETDG